MGVGVDGRGATAGRDRDADNGHPRPSASRILLLGRPGAGKGTQGARLAERLRVQHLSTGDLLRREMAIGSALGTAVERLVGAGRLVPSGLMIAIVEVSLGPDGYVLDGFPRTVIQAEALFDRRAFAPNKAIEIVVEHRIVLERLQARGRCDDSWNVVRDRLTTYDLETKPTLEWLARRGVLSSVDGRDQPDVVARHIWRALFPSAGPLASGGVTTKRRGS